MSMICSFRDLTAKKDLPIVYVDHGIANRFDDRIEVNKALRDYKKHPHLHDYVIKHEKEHTDKKWSLKDLLLEFQFANYKYGLHMLDFIIETPSARRDLKPVFVQDGIRYIDYNLLIVYIGLAIFLPAFFLILF